MSLFLHFSFDDHFRRNEPIKNVREAAELALKRIGGDEAEETVKLTKVLSEEMSNLRGSSK